MKLFPLGLDNINHNYSLFKINHVLENLQQVNIH